jgi:phosphatidylserine synthase
MLDLATRQAKELLLAPLAAVFAPLHPNAITALSLLCGVACFAASLHARADWALGMWVANRVLDGLDGVVARRYGKTSDFGGYFDIVCDFAVYGLIPWGIARGSGDPQLMDTACFLLIT